MEALLRFIEGEVESGQNALADAARRMIYQRAPEWLELLNFEDDSTFLDPFLFAVLSDQGSTAHFPLAQVLWGRTRPEKRPRCLPVISDAHGIVWLSGAGTFATKRPRETFELYQGEQTELRGSDGPVNCTLQPPRFLGNGKLELLQRPHPLFERFFVDQSGIPIDYEVIGSGPTVAKLSGALETLRQTMPRIQAAIMAVTTTAVIFEGAGINSFSNPAAHGAVFLNLSSPPTDASFIDDLAHQGGHVLFSALTFDVSAYLTVSETTRLREFSGAADDSRTVYAALHGVFTEALIALSLESILCEGRRDQRHEVRGRLGFILRRFGTDLSSLLEHRQLFSQRGSALLESIAEVLCAIFRRHGAMAEAMNFSNQSYTFDYERYSALNPS